MPIKRIKFVRKQNLVIKSKVVRLNKDLMDRYDIISKYLSPLSKLLKLSKNELIKKLNKMYIQSGIESIIDFISKFNLSIRDILLDDINYRFFSETTSNHSSQKNIANEIMYRKIQKTTNLVDPIQYDKVIQSTKFMDDLTLLTNENEIVDYMNDIYENAIIDIETKYSEMNVVKGNNITVINRYMLENVFNPTHYVKTTTIQPSKNAKEYLNEYYTSLLKRYDFEAKKKQLSNLSNVDDTSLQIDIDSLDRKVMLKLINVYPVRDYNKKCLKHKSFLNNLTMLNNMNYITKTYFYVDSDYSSHYRSIKCAKIHNKLVSKFSEIRHKMISQFNKNEYYDNESINYVYKGWIKQSDDIEQIIKRSNDLRSGASIIFKSDCVIGVATFNKKINFSIDKPKRIVDYNHYIPTSTKYGKNKWDLSNSGKISYAFYLSFHDFMRLENRMKDKLNWRICETTLEFNMIKNIAPIVFIQNLEKGCKFGCSIESYKLIEEIFEGNKSIIHNTKTKWILKNVGRSSRSLIKGYRSPKITGILPYYDGKYKNLKNVKVNQFYMKALLVKTNLPFHIVSKYKSFEAIEEFKPQTISDRLFNRVNLDCISKYYRESYESESDVSLDKLHFDAFNVKMDRESKVELDLAENKRFLNYVENEYKNKKNTIDKRWIRKNNKDKYSFKLSNVLKKRNAIRVFKALSVDTFHKSSKFDKSQKDDENRFGGKSDLFFEARNNIINKTFTFTIVDKKMFFHTPTTNSRNAWEKKNYLSIRYCSHMLNRSLINPKHKVGRPQTCLSLRGLLLLSLSKAKLLKDKVSQYEISYLERVFSNNMIELLEDPYDLLDDIISRFQNMGLISLVYKFSKIELVNLKDPVVIMMLSETLETVFQLRENIDFKIISIKNFDDMIEDLTIQIEESSNVLKYEKKDIERKRLTDFIKEALNQIEEIQSDKYRLKRDIGLHNKKKSLLFLSLPTIRSNILNDIHTYLKDNFSYILPKVKTVEVIGKIIPKDDKEKKLMDATSKYDNIKKARTDFWNSIKWGKTIDSIENRTYSTKNVNKFDFFMLLGRKVDTTFLDQYLNLIVKRNIIPKRWKKSLRKRIGNKNTVNKFPIVEKPKEIIAENTYLGKIHYKLVKFLNVDVSKQTFNYLNMIDVIATQFNLEDSVKEIVEFGTKTKWIKYKGQYIYCIEVLPNKFIEIFYK